MTLNQNDFCAVVVPVYNEEAIVERLLDALCVQTTKPDKIYVVDNGSTDATAKIVHAYARSDANSKLQLVAEKKKGTGAACNTGFRVAIESGAGLVLRTDADCVPDPRWVERMVMSASKYPDKKLFAGRLVPLRDEWYKPGDEMLLPAGLRIIKSGLSISNRSRVYSKIAIGSNMMIRTEAYQAVGGFERVGIDDKDEDISLSIRVLRMYGANSICNVSDAVVAVSMRRPRAQGAWTTLFRHIAPNTRKNQKTHDIR